MIWRPNVTVAAVIEHDARFLLVEEVVDGRRVLNQPAGHLDEGETLVHAVVRETLEETAWHFHPEALIGIYRWRHPIKGTTFLRATFCGAVSAWEAERVLDDGILSACWLTPDELAARAAQIRSPMVTRSIDDYLAGHRYPLALLADVT